MNYLLWSLFGPATWPFWLIAATALALMTGAERMARRVALLAAALIVVMAVLPTGFWLMQRLESAYPLPQTLPAIVTDIVVLAGAEKMAESAASGGLEINSHGERITEAMVLAQLYPAARLWIVGGVSKGFASRDVDVTARYWSRAGIDAARIHSIGGTFDTCANARGIAAEINAPILLVTSAFHMPRSMACMRAAGVNAIPYAVDTQVWRTNGIADAFSAKLVANLARTDLALHEYAGLMYYRLTGRIRAL